MPAGAAWADGARGTYAGFAWNQVLNCVSWAAKKLWLAAPRATMELDVYPQEQRDEIPMYYCKGLLSASHSHDLSRTLLQSKQLGHSEWVVRLTNN
jgi:hypothetical protein